MNVDEKWERRINKINKLPNQFNLIEVNDDNVREAYNFDINYFVENEYKFGENDIPNRRYNKRDLMYKIKQDNENIHLKSYKNGVTLMNVLPKSKLKDFMKIKKEDKVKEIIKFDKIDEVARKFISKPVIYKDKELTRQHLRENPQQNKDVEVDYVLNRYYFI